LGRDALLADTGGGAGGLGFTKRGNSNTPTRFPVVVVFMARVRYGELFFAGTGRPRGLRREGTLRTERARGRGLSSTFSRLPLIRTAAGAGGWSYVLHADLDTTLLRFVQIFDFILDRVESPNY